MAAFYSEHDAYAAQWLRNLIAAGHIAPGDVDEGDIRDIRPSDLAGYAQCHFFAGIGVWSHALRSAGWPDDRPVWTGSCPCQPFSAAGARGGVADERHLWPHFFHLIEECRPAIVLGEQVASKDGLGWLDLVSNDLEGSNYAFGASDLCAAGFSGSHIRQRLYFTGVANTNNNKGPQGWPGVPERTNELPTGPGSVAGGLADSDSGQRDGVTSREGGECDGEAPGRQQSDCQSERGGAGGGLDDAAMPRRDGALAGPESHPRDEARLRVSGERCGQDAARSSPAPMLGRHPVDWLFCRDGKWRPVGPGTFPLVDEAPSRVGRLRAYGNALDAETATGFIGAVTTALADASNMLSVL